MFMVLGDNAGASTTPAGLGSIPLVVVSICLGKKGGTACGIGVSAAVAVDMKPVAELALRIGWESVKVI